MADDSSALMLLLSGDPTLFDIVRLSLVVSLAATALAGLIGFPLGAFLALVRFPGRTGLIVVLNAFMGLPPVVVGLVAYLMLSRSGPLGFLDLLFSPTAMVIAQSILVLPILASLTRQIDRGCLHHVDPGFGLVRAHPPDVQGKDRNRRESGRARNRAGSRHRQAR